MIDLNEIMEQFCLDDSIEEYGEGHINETYVTKQKKYILQRINTDIFKDYSGLMENVVNVTEFLKKKITEAGGDPERETLTVIKTKNGENFYRYNDKYVYRVYKFIPNSKAISTSDNPVRLYYAAKGFGKFQKMLSDYPADTLVETIENFHNTPMRFEALEAAIAADKVGRAASVKEEIDFALSQKDFISEVMDGLDDGSIPLRVTHNDTKINNVLFEEDGDEAVCVIDLDTVMPGSLLYDFGDALRVGGATAAEDETDLSKVWFNVDAFRYFTKGFFEEMADSMTEREKDLLPLSVKLMTYECGIRFLTDYLDGDNYFKIHREHHNLDRARTQFKLVKDIDSRMEELSSIVKNTLV